MKNKIFFLIICVTFILIGCEQTNPSEKLQTKKGMIKVTILYPNDEGKTFDMDYYSNKHMPMLAELFGDSLKELEIDKGISGRTPNDSVPYLAIGYLYFDSVSDYENSFGPNATKILGDIPNYTNIQPIVQISEVVQ